jgi:leader peptidase (prepilin peptidase)/N-methyltransferase
MDYIALLQSHTLLFTGMAVILGLLVGSFLNVVIHRVPIMLMHRWKQDCTELVGNPPTEVQPPEKFNLLYPASRCPHCNHKITALENIPVLSYLWLRGKCSSCRRPISPRYPLIELLTALLTGVVAWRLGFGTAGVAAIVLTWVLIALSFIDIDHHLLPDVMVLPFLWAGLLLNLTGTFTPLPDAVIGAVAGYLSLWCVYHLFKLVTGKEGMGYGDFKLYALFGAWLGWKSLPLVILLSSFVGALIGIALIVLRGRDRAQPLPFGPYLATAGWVAMLWGEQIMTRYLQLVRF